MDEVPNGAPGRVPGPDDKQRALLQSLVDSAYMHAIVGCDSNGLIDAWSEGARRFYGYDAVEVLGKNISLLWPAAEPPAGIFQHIAEQARDARFWTGKAHQARKGADGLLADITVYPRDGAGEKSPGYVFVAQRFDERAGTQVVLREFLEAAPDAMLLVTARGEIAQVNMQVLKLFGYTAGELINQNVDVLVPDSQRGRHAAHRDSYWRAPKARPMAAGIELAGRRKDGSEFPVEISLSPMPIAGEQFIAAVVRDISDTRRMLRELRESQEYNRGLIESNIDALMTTDPLGIITDVNRMMCEITGYPRQELIGAPFNRYFTNPKQADAGIRKVLAEDRVTNYELTVRSRTGKETVVSYNATTFKDARGRLKGVFAAARDITAQKGLEEELRQTQNYTRGLIESSVDALVTVDPDIVVTDVNEQMIKLTGYAREELIGSAFTDYFTDPKRAEAGVQKTLAENFVTDYVLVLRAKNGKETSVSFNASVFKNTEGNVKGIFAAARDITEQKRLEEQLRQAQNYTRGLIESSVDPMITVDPGLTITDVNEQMVRLTEIAKDKLIGSRFDGYFTEPGRAAAGVRKTLKEAYVTNYELTLRTPGGREVLVSFNASVFKDTEGNVKGVFAVARDVTAQRRLEGELREQQNYARGLIEASVDALMTVSPEGVITDVNEQTVKLTGYNRKQLIGSTFAQYFTDSDRARAGVRQTFDAGAVTNYELVLRSRGGTETVVSFNASVFKDTAGNVAGILAGARDIAQQKKIELEVREQQAYNRGLIESNIDALMTTDSIGVITDVNRQMCAVTGRTREELIGTPFKNYFTDPQRAEDGIRKVLAESRVTNYELTLRAKDGKETVVSYNATTFTGEDGKLRGVFAAARDITAQKSLEQQFRQAQNYTRGLIESSIDPMITVDPDLTITDVNEQMVKLTGYSREQLIGSAFQDYFTEPERASGGVKKTLDEGYVTNYELTLRSRHRREILVSFNASVFKDTEGRVRGIFAVARDITEQRRLEEQLREQQNYSRGLIESSVDALVTVDPDIIVTDVNGQMIKLTGYTREELVGSSFKDYFTEPERAASGVRKTLGEGSVTNYELVLKSKAGKRTVVSFNAGTFRDTAGQVVGILAAARDITQQKRLEEQLRDQQSYNRSLIESSVDALMTVDPNGVITDVNDQTAKLFGYNRKQLIGSPFKGYFTDAERAQTGVRQTFEAGSVTNYELVARAKTGRKLPVSFNAAVFRDTAGQVVGILAAARDITEQKRIELELREQQSYTRTLIESNIDALMTTDPLGIITDVNRQMCEVTGRTSDELIGTPFKNYFTDPLRAEAGVRQVLAENKVTNYELTLRAKDGRETVVSYNATTFRDADGRLKGVFAAARDITDQKHLEGQITQRNTELTETTTFLNNVLESSTEYSIIAKDLDGNILTWNEGARRNYGYTAEEMVGGNTSLLHTPEDLASGRVKALFEQALVTGKAEGVFERRRRSGERFTASVSVTLRRDSGGRPIGYLLISKDITEQKRLEEQLRRKNEELEEQYRRVQEANRLKSEFLANMSHELRSPLNGIIGFSELMHDGKVGPVSPDHKEYLGDILTSSKHLLQLINDVLDLAKVESGKMEFHPEPTDLAKVIGEVRDVLRTLMSRTRINMVIDVEPSLTNIVTDSAKLKQVLYNYLSNALKFSPEGGQVRVRVRAEDAEYYRIEVEDSGIGIKPEDLHRLFVEFQQLDASMAKKYQGTGLGLALTKRIVEAQGGRVGVTSDFGHGSVFYAVLPRTASDGITPVKTPALWKYPGAALVLIIEDDEKDRGWLQQVLQREGYEVEIARDGGEALRRCRTRRYDAVLLDLLLPDIGGWEILQTVRAQGPNQNTPVIVVSATSDSGVSQAFTVQDFLIKPVNRDALLQALNAAHLTPGERDRVLIVDDDVVALKLMDKSLTELGYRPVTVSDGTQGLNLVEHNRPDAVILDLLMPGIDGFEFLRLFRRVDGCADVPVIIWTSKDLTLTEHARLREAAQGIVAKSAEEGVKPLLDELRKHLSPPPTAPKAAANAKPRTARKPAARGGRRGG